LKILAGTGHRPKFCPCKYKDDHPWLADLKDRLRSFLSNQECIVRSGMALGWDLWLAEVALELGIEVHAYVPFQGQAQNWPTKSRKKYEKVINQVGEIHYTSEEYYPNVFLDRDIQLIEGSNEVLALLNPEAKTGGTYYTVNEAKKRGIHVVNFWKN